MVNLKIPHVFVLLTAIIFVFSLLSYVIPSGKFETKKEKLADGVTRAVLVPGTYHKLKKNISFKGLIIQQPNTKDGVTPTSLIGFLSAIPKGMKKAASIIFFIFLVGGVFGILDKTGTIVAIINTLLKYSKKSHLLLTVICMLTIGIAGSTIGAGEELIPLVPVFLMVSSSLGLDKIYGLAILYMSSQIGFAAATTNPFTVQVAQSIAQVPLCSGMSFRILFFICTMTVTILYVLRYAKKVKADPANSYVYTKGNEEEENLIHAENSSVELQKSHIITAVVAIIVFALAITAVQLLGWWLSEMSGAFLLIGIVAAILGHLSVDETASAFVSGMKDMTVAALVVGFATGIQVVLNNTQTMDTLIFYASGTLQHIPQYLAAVGMFVFQVFLNFFIPSGSGQAAVTMPLMAPLADVLHISRQTAVFAFTCGDGFSNTVIPTSGILMAMLSLAKIIYTKWLKFMLPLFGLLFLLSSIFLIIAVFIGY
ncbi:MAG: AbgT family transporter [Victivallales bacterium]|nr:AbgT family transporter [Victivallales bacterium]